jgi:heavy metal translocating P-type ATPase
MRRICDGLEELMCRGGTKKDIVLLILAGIGVVMSLFRIKLLPFDMAWLAIVLCGIPITLEAFIGLIRDHDITADVLVALALWASVFIGEIFAAGEVAFIMQLGGLLEELTVARARAGIERLVHLTPRTARVLLADGTEKIVPAEEVKIGDRILVKPGETIAVDGVLIKGQTSIDQAVMTGESLPVEKTEGDEVYSGTVNQYGAFEMEATKIGEDSSIQRMIRLVQSADAGKAKIVSMADRWAVWIVIGAASIALLSYLFTHEMIRSVTVLVVFCPCALVLATPTAIMAGIGNVTKHGFLVREGDALERLSAVHRILFDKTGTLTYGTPEVTEVIAANGFEKNEILAMAAAVEQSSEHPLGKAIVRKAQKQEDSLPQVNDFKMIPGQGVSGKIGVHCVIAGNRKMLDLQKIVLPDAAEAEVETYTNTGSTMIHVAVDEKYAGMIALTDTPRQDSRGMIRKLSELDVTPTLLTGDNERSAETIAGQVGISTFHASCMPEDKIRWIRQYAEKGEKTCMIGDGINDAPSLKTADVGIAMGGVGSDIAVDASDIVLINDEVKELPHLIALSRHMMKVIQANLTFSMVLNFIAVSLAVTGILNPVWGALVHNAGSVFVIVNSSFLLTWKKK